MALLKNPIARVVGNSNPSKIDLVCEVNVQFSDLDRALLQNAQNASAFRVEFSFGSDDSDQFRTAKATIGSLGSINVSLSMGNPEVQVVFTKTFSRGAQLNEDPFPFPNQEDEIYVSVNLRNLFDNSVVSFASSASVKGEF